MNELNLADAPSDLNLKLVRYAPHAILACHHHDEASLGIVLGGGVEEVANGECGEHRLGAMTTKPAQVRHGNRFGPAGAILLSIKNGPLPAFAPRSWRWTKNVELGRRGLAIACAMRDGDRFGAAQEGVWDLIGIGARYDEAPSVGPLWLARIRDEAAASVARPSIAAIARSAGVHPVYLTRAFRRWQGCSITSFVRRLRVDRATDLLLRSDEHICAIAAALGFADQSHLCRVFRAELGISPSTYRALTAGASPPN